MNLKHAKSPCCGTKIRRFGLRRRQCTHCKRTWTIRPRKRGRPQYRFPGAIIKKVLLNKYPLSQLARRKGSPKLPAFRYRFRQTLRRFISRPFYREIPPGPLIILADALWFRFKEKQWTLYLTAVKPCRGGYATFLDPILIAGKEGASRWKYVFRSIPVGIRKRIKGMVIDNLRGMQMIAGYYHWVLQLCQFHLILKLQFHRRGLRRALKGGMVREEIYQLIRTALEIPQSQKLNIILARLREMAKTSCGTERMQAVVREFLHCLGYYRAYRIHPKLGLPATTNAVESMGGVIRDLLRRNHSASSPAALFLWAMALIRARPKIVCNSKISTE